MSFLEPVFLYLLVPLAIAFVLWLCAVLAHVVNRPPKTYGSRYPLVGKLKLWGFALLAGILMILALAKPYLAQNVTAISKGNVEIILVIDRSISMRADDLGMLRLEAAKREALNIEPLLTEGDRMALFVFGKESHRKVYLTKKYQTVFERVGAVYFPESLKGDGTVWDSDFASMLESIYQSLDRQDAYTEGVSVKRYVPKKRSNRIVVIISDGEDQFRKEKTTYYIDTEYKEKYIKRLNQALAEFRRRGLKIYPVGIGTARGSSWVSLLRGYKKGEDYEAYLPQREDWKTGKTRIDKENLILLARSTGVGLAGYIWTIENRTTTVRSYLGSAVNSNRSISFELGVSEDELLLWQYCLLAAVSVLVCGILSYPFQGYFRRLKPSS